MNGLKDLLYSERGVFCILLVVASTVLAAFGVITGQMWIDFNKYLAIALVGGKTLTTAVETYALKKPQIPPATVVDAPKDPA